MLAALNLDQYLFRRQIVAQAIATIMRGPQPPVGQKDNINAIAQAFGPHRTSAWIGIAGEWIIGGNVANECVAEDGGPARITLAAPDGDIALRADRHIEHIIWADAGGAS